jgi:CRP-like cAMP-binding protein
MCPATLPDLQSLHLEVMDHSLGVLAPSTVAFIPHAAIHDLVERYTGIASALWRDTLVDAAIFREWIANVGGRSAHQRAAHLMCEFVSKMKAVGLGTDEACPFPLTQQEIGDALGLSVVHVNRTLQQLRAEGLIVLKGKHLSIPDWEALKQVAGFDPAYLHVNRRAAA